jgi:hypothetical protein
MATIPPKTWSWRRHYSVIKVKLVVNEGTLSIHVN